MENKELKVKSFRVDENTFAKFKEIASKEFGNQSQCLEALINIYETEEAKAILINRELEIETFQDYINKINRLFITSLQMSSDAEERAKEVFLKKIETKDGLLETLKSKLDENKIENKKLLEENKILINEAKGLKTKIVELEENKNTLTQLANRNSDLADRLKLELEEFEKELSKYKDLKKENEKYLDGFKGLKQQIDGKNNIINDLKLKNESYEERIKSLREKNNNKTNEINSYKSLLDAVKRESKAEIEAMESKYKEDYLKALNERETLLKREYELDKKELELKIRELELKK